ncbi:MAG: hypothetical protein QXU82_01555 [Candidatus Aenigmatarchaeota archaeon]
MKLQHEGKARADVTKLTGRNRYTGDQQVEGTASVDMQEMLESLQLQGAISGNYREGDGTVMAVLNDYASDIGKTLMPKPEAAQKCRNVKLSFQHSGEIAFYDGEKRVGGCITSGSHVRMRISNFDIEEIERGKGYGTAAAKELIDYSKRLGRMLIFETCGLGKTCEWLQKKDFEVVWWPKSHFDDYAYLCAPGQHGLKEKMNDLESCGFGSGATMAQIREFGKLVRKRTKDITD